VGKLVDLAVSLAGVAVQAMTLHGILLPAFLEATINSLRLFFLES